MVPTGRKIIVTSIGFIHLYCLTRELAETHSGRRTQGILSRRIYQEHHEVYSDHLEIETIGTYLSNYQQVFRDQNLEILPRRITTQQRSQTKTQTPYLTKRLEDHYILS